MSANMLEAIAADLSRLLGRIGRFSLQDAAKVVAKVNGEREDRGSSYSEVSLCANEIRR